VFKLINLRHGAILNSKNGTELDGALSINIEGLNDSLSPVFVNSVVSQQQDHHFKAKVKLQNKFNEIIFKTTNNYGKFQQKINLIWDKNSFKRYNFYIDDHIFFLTDIAKQQPRSLFNHFYLKGLKNLHDQYGTKFTLNIFYKNDHHSFTLDMFPDKYKSEWLANIDWLRLSFHAYSEFPDRPYQNATIEKLATDYDLVKSEIVRFAGEETFITPPCIHWGMVLPESFDCLKQRGVKFLSGDYMDVKTYVGEEDRDSHTTDIGYYQDLTNSSYLVNNHIFYDFKHGLMFIKNDICCNLFQPKVILVKLAELYDSDVYNTTIGLASHEQYSFDYYSGYLHDYFNRMETAIRSVTEHGYCPVFFQDGLLGNCAWNK
jgi:hypothetical protein